MSFPFTPRRLASFALDRLIDRRERLAATDPRWAEIEARRQSDDGNSVLLSENLSWADYAEQRDIERRLTTEPWWEPLARTVYSAPHRPIRRELRTRWQMSSRGWADQDLWNLDTHLTTRLADQLEALASAGNGWPGDPWESPEHWQAELRRQAELLRRYGSDPELESLLTTWHDLASSRHAEPDAADAAMAALRHREEANLEGARSALRWVADHLDRLWD